MNTNKIKSYAIQARRDFLKAVTGRANFYGIFGDNHIEEMTFKGDVAIIADRPIPKKEGELRQRLVDRIKRNGFEMTLRADAYSWFNRFAALRYMELHGYLDHGLRVLSHPEGSDMPEILEHAAEVDLPGLNKNKVIELRLAGHKDNELYRLLIISQCNALHSAMPFLFDKIDSETELLLPENLLHSDSLIRKLVADIPEDDWREVEIIGWLYQFYITEKKDEVIGKTVKSEDIPAATQLFTPKWIVKYMVQNTLGRMWLATYPDSPLRSKMEYYIAPAEQEPDVQKQLDAITPKELSPETITFFDPAQGSGHILVEAYDIFKEIYLERGYRTRDIPRLILEKNLYGLDICDRAAQLAGFALMMKARADDRKILGYTDLKLNVYAIQDSRPSDVRNIEMFFSGDALQAIREDLRTLAELFENAKTFGSLITIPEPLASRMPENAQTVEGKIVKWVAGSDVHNLRALVNQAKLLARKYDCVVTNPPYMGSKGMNGRLTTWAKEKYQHCWDRGTSDLYAMFIDRAVRMTLQNGATAMITMQGWMFTSSFELLRSCLLADNSLPSLIHLGTRAFDSIAGHVVSTVAFVFQAKSDKGQRGHFFRLTSGENEESKRKLLAENVHANKNGIRHAVHSKIFNKIPGSPVSYWISNKQVKNFETFPLISSIADFKAGLSTGDNTKFQRAWHEVDLLDVAFACNSSHEIANRKWIPCNSGGTFRKWYGNNEIIIFWKDNGEAIKQFRGSAIRNEDEYFKPGLTYNKISSGKFACRKKEAGFIFDDTGRAIVCDREKTDTVQALLSSSVAHCYLDILAPTLSFTSKELERIPFCEPRDLNSEIVKSLVKFSRIDWDSYETSWDFASLPLLNPDYCQLTLKATYQKLRAHWREMTLEMQGLEQENNRIFIETYALQDELTPEVPLSEITLTCNPHYRYNGNKTDDELETQRMTDTMEELISYAIGCMMGRYSLDEPGLIYAHSGNIGFDPSKYKVFPADDDGIIPIMDMPWFPDDAANRFVEFMKTAWPAETLNENLKFVADQLAPKNSEDPIDTIRRYLSAGFFKDHLKTYKKRPIYWLFSSGKQKAFECLVYLHRYNESTLSRMRSLYVTPLQGNIRSRIEFLDREQKTATSASDQRKFQKEMDMLKKKQTELAKFDDELRHYADTRISLDLDDGVKVNYGKFGNLLAEVKAITGE